MPSGPRVDGCAQPAGEGAGTPGNLTPHMPDWGMPRSHGRPSSCLLPLPTPSPGCSQPLPPPWRAQTSGAPAAAQSLPHLHPPDAMGAPSRSSPPTPARDPLQGLFPLQDQETHQCCDTFLYRPGAPGHWGYFRCQVRDGAGAVALARRRPGVCRSQHPLCTEKCPLNSCVQLASSRHAYRASGFSPGISGDSTAACCV